MTLDPSDKQGCSFMMVAMLQSQSEVQYEQPIYFNLGNWRAKATKETRGIEAFRGVELVIIQLGR